MNNQIIDGMKKESRKARNVAVVCYLFAILNTLYIYLANNEKYSNSDIRISILYFIFGTFSLYLWLYAVKYRVMFDNEKIHLKTLFKKIELNICDVEKYTCNRYKKSVFYQFNLFVNDKKILINTRYKEELEKILNNHI